jgi:hypothetical protein
VKNSIRRSFKLRPTPGGLKQARVLELRAGIIREVELRRNVRGERAFICQFLGDKKGGMPGRDDPTSHLARDAIDNYGMSGGGLEMFWDGFMFKEPSSIVMETSHARRQGVSSVSFY